MSVAGSHDRGIWHHSGPGDSLCEAIVGKQSDFWILHYPYFVNLMMSMAIKDFTAWFFCLESPAFKCFQVFCLLREGESLEQMINVLVRITVNFKRHYYLIFFVEIMPCKDQTSKGLKRKLSRVNLDDISWMSFNLCGPLQFPWSSVPWHERTFLSIT